MKLLWINWSFAMLSWCTIMNSQWHVAAEMLECKYEVNRWSFMNKSVYWCNVMNKEIFTGDRKIIEGAEGAHIADKSDDDVRGLVFRNANVCFFPTGIEDVFENIVMIYMGNSNLKEITKDDIKVFPALKYLYLGNSLLMVLREDTFSHNLRLELLLFQGNKIKHIDSGTFTHLTELRYLNLLGSDCNSTGEVKTRETVEALVRSIDSGGCTLAEYVTENPLEATIKGLRTQLQEEEEHNTKLTQMINDMRAILMGKDQRNQ